MDPATPMQPKPRLLFLRFGGEEILPRFIQIHLDEQRRCLEQFFDVVVVTGDCDYGELCERHQPDIAMFESGIYARPRIIRNATAHPKVPKIGFLHADAYCASRSLFLSDMDRLGVDTFFTLSISMAEYLPEIADNLFVWPNFVDPAVCRDYGSPKLIPILFTGSQVPHYPWRRHMRELLAKHYPVMTCPHYGWRDARMTRTMVHGEAYARMLNAALVSPACGTIANELVRKHLEIPACGTLLLAERTAALEAAGFRDMENCVFASGSETIDKLGHLFEDRDALERITRAGHDLVHARHTMQQRDQILQWFRMRASLRPGQRILQTDPFRPLAVVDRTSSQRNMHPPAAGRDRALLKQAMAALERRNIAEAERCSLAMLNYHGDIPEAKLCLALCHLHSGRPDQALELLAHSVARLMKEWGATEPDPVEWTYIIVALLCRGDVAAARKCAEQFPNLAHPEFDACRAAIITLSAQDPGSVRHDRRARASMHILPPRDLASWAGEICAMLQASGQAALARRLASAVQSATPMQGGALMQGAKLKRGPSQMAPNIAVPPVPGPIRVRLRHAARAAILRRPWMGRAFSGAQHHVGHFLEWCTERGALRHHRVLPFAARLREADRSCRALRALAERDDISSVLLLTGPLPTAHFHAARQGAARSPARPAVFRLIHSSPDALLGNAARTPLRELKGVAGVERFDLVVIDGALPQDWNEIEEVRDSPLIWVGATTSLANHMLVRRLTEGGSHDLLDADPSHLGGYVLLALRSVTLASGA
ncbi:MAG: glycosyltransferase [Acetobacteraceae bacterium]|nr:glycosyltransferase [Acetobacteraceae bacterium]